MKILIDLGDELEVLHQVRGIALADGLGADVPAVAFQVTKGRSSSKSEPKAGQPAERTSPGRRFPAGYERPAESGQHRWIAAVHP